MTPIAALAVGLGVASAPVPASPPPTAADARAILRLVMALETRVHAQAEVGPPPCVRPWVGPASLGGARRRVEAWERPQPPAPPPAPMPPGAVTVVNSSELRFSPFARWQRLGDMHRGYIDIGGPLSADAEAAIREAERAAMVAAPQRRLVAMIERAWFGPPLAFCHGDHWQPVLEIESPTIVGQFAFVDVAFQCVLCGQGVRLAFRRVRSGWEIVAAAERWVS